MPKRQTTPLAIIGGGSAAFACALQAARDGTPSLIIESGTLGGTCVNVGCVPSKALVGAAATVHTAAAHRFAGLTHQSPQLSDPRALLLQRQALVEDLRQRKYLDILQQQERIQWLRGRARFLDSHSLTVTGRDGDTTHVRAEHILVATGAVPHVPDLPGLAGTPYWTSDQALQQTELPAHLLILGASTVAVELAQAFRRLGSRVTILARSTLLSRQHPTLAAAVREAFAAEGIEVRERTVVNQVEYGQGFTLSTEGGPVHGDRLLVAAGRRPDTGALALDRADVATDALGHIVVDDCLRTSAANVYAAGDCTALPQYVYVAAAAGTRAAMNMHGANAPLDLNILPAVIFVDPQVATVGLSESQAEAQGLSVMSRTLPMHEVPRAQVDRDLRGFVTLVAEAGSGRLLGARVVARDGGEIIQTAATAIRAGMGVHDLASGLYPYLTRSESLKLCAQTFTRDVSQLSCCAG